MTEDGSQPLHLACKKGHRETGKLLLSHGADANAVNKNGWTLLHVAASGQKDCPEMCEILLNHDARIDAVTEDGSQLLHVACIFGHRELGNCCCLVGLMQMQRTKMNEHHYMQQLVERKTVLKLRT